MGWAGNGGFFLDFDLSVVSSYLERSGFLQSRR